MRPRAARRNVRRMSEGPSPRTAHGPPDAHSSLQNQEPPDRPPPDMPELHGSQPVVATALTHFSAAEERINKRYKEMLESECTMCEGMQHLLAALHNLTQDKAWKLGQGHVELVERTRSCVDDLVRVHSAIREKMATFAGVPVQLTAIFESSKDDLVTAHGQFQTLSTCVMAVLQKKAGGQVVGDRAVGTAVKKEGSLAAELLPIQDLLVRPSQRVMKYKLFLEEMATDARRSENWKLEKELQETVSIVGSIVTDINERIRRIQRRERVNMIAARVRGVPSDVSIVKAGREFLLDDGFFRERGRAGYRHLYLFNDSLLVCKPGENLLGKVFSLSHDQDLKFKRLIPFSSLRPSIYPQVCEPSIQNADSPESPGGMLTLPFFELRDGVGTCSFHHSEREKVVEWVQAIQDALHKCPTAPGPAHRMPNSAEETTILTQDLSDLDLSDYVILDHDGSTTDGSPVQKEMPMF